MVIHIENLGKRYYIGSRGSYLTLRDSIIDITTTVRKKIILRQSLPIPTEMWALRRVSFHVNEGEVVGVIGPNGAGKSTLLKIISRITIPTEGYVEYAGNVGALLEVGTGFHPELTGAENIYLYGAILGIPRKHINETFDDIVKFSELEKFMNTPVKRYSSGMWVRLAFSVAASMEPDIFIIDESLSVGDQKFQEKCLKRIKEISQSGKTILFVSHNMASIREFCNRVVWLDSGTVQMIGSPDKVTEAYLSRSS